MAVFLSSGFPLYKTKYESTTKSTFKMEGYLKMLTD